MLTKTRAIVLKTLKYGDRKIFVDMFTEEYGMITFSCSAGKRKGGGNTNILQPMNIVEVEFDKKPKGDIQAMKGIRIDTAYASIPFDAYKLSISLFLAEFLKYALMNEQQNAIIFDYITHSIEWLDNARSNFSNFHIIFMVHLSQFIGFAPNTEEFYPGSLFDMREGTFTLMMPTHKQVLRPADATLVPLLARLTYSTMHLLRLSRNERNQCTEYILEYYKLHLPAFPDMKSFSILRELFV